MFYAFEHTRLWLPTVALTAVVIVVLSALWWKRSHVCESASAAGATIGTLLGTVMIYLASGEPFNTWAIILVPIFMMSAAVVAGGTAALMWIMLKAWRRRRV